MKRLLVALIPVLLLGAACSSGKDASDAASGHKVTVAHVPSTLFAPLYVAQAKGYFTQEGLTVGLQTVKAGQDVIPLAASGKVDVVAAGFSAGMFNAIHSGLHLKVVGSMGLSTGDPKASPTALEVSKKLVQAGKVTSPSDLRGHKVAVAGGGGAAGAYQLATVLQQSGLSLRDVEIVNIAMPDMQTAIANGSVDAALPPAPFTTRMEQAGIAVPLGAPPVGTSAAGVIYGTTFAKTPTAKKFFTALTRASQDLQGEGAKSAENLKILAQATGQDLTVLQAVPSYIWRPDLAPQPDQLDKQQQAYRDAGLLDYIDHIPAKNYVSPEFSEKK